MPGTAKRQTNETPHSNMWRARDILLRDNNVGGVVQYTERLAQAALGDGEHHEPVLQGDLTWDAWAGPAKLGTWRGRRSDPIRARTAAPRPVYADRRATGPRLWFVYAGWSRDGLWQVLAQVAGPWRKPICRCARQRPPERCNGMRLSLDTPGRGAKIPLAGLLQCDEATVAYHATNPSITSSDRTR